MRLPIPCLLLLVASLVACGEAPAAGPEGPPPAVVQVVTAEARTLPRTLSAVGGLESAKTAAVAAEVAGTLVALDLPEGERVVAGHVLARLDEHSPSRKSLAVDPTGATLAARPVRMNRAHHFKVERADGRTVRWLVDDIEILVREAPRLPATRDTGGRVLSSMIGVAR